MQFKVRNNEAQASTQTSRLSHIMARLRMKCSCGHWNRVPVNKIFLEQPSPDPKVKLFISMYEPLETSKCEKCGKVIENLES